MGYFAATLVFCTFYMRTMLPLRWMAIASNVGFLAYAIPLQLWPIVILHGLLLPLNALRLRQLYRMLANLRAATTQNIDVTKFLAHLVHYQHPAGMVLFSKGDPGDCAYYIAGGEVDIPERHTRLGAGQFFGEVGVFASSGARTFQIVRPCFLELGRHVFDDLTSAAKRLLHADMVGEGVNVLQNPILLRARLLPSGQFLGIVRT